MMKKIISSTCVFALLIASAHLCFIFANDKIMDLDSANSEKRDVVSNQDLFKQHFDTAKKYLKQGSDDLAINELSKAIDLDPKNTNAYDLRAGAYIRTGNNIKAISDYTKLIQLSPNDACAYSCRGFVYYEIGRNDEATADFKKASKLNPEMSIAMQGDTSTTKQVCNIPSTKKPYTNIKKVTLLQKPPSQKLKQAIEKPSLQKLDREVTYIQECIARGINFSNTGEFERAQKEFSEAISRNPYDPEPYLLRANVYINIGNTKNALADIEKTLKLKPDNKVALAKHFEIVLSIEKEFKQKTLQDSLSFIKIEPTNPKYYKVAAKIYFQESRYFAATTYAILYLKVEISNKVNNLLKIFVINK